MKYLPSRLRARRLNIHLNPVRAGMVRTPLDYPYSSYERMLSGENCDLLDRKEILNFFFGKSGRTVSEVCGGSDYA